MKKELQQVQSKETSEDDQTKGKNNVKEKQQADLKVCSEISKT